MLNGYELEVELNTVLRPGRFDGPAKTWIHIYTVCAITVENRGSLSDQTEMTHGELAIAPQDCRSLEPPKPPPFISSPGMCSKQREARLRGRGHAAAITARVGRALFYCTRHTARQSAGELLGNTCAVSSPTT